MISYGKLWILLEQKKMKRTDLLKIVSSPTLAKLGKNESVNVSIIAKICDFLECQPGDIMENITEEQVKAVAEQFDNFNKIMIDSLTAQGIDEKQFMEMLNQTLPIYMKTMFNGGNPMQDLMMTALKEKEEEQAKKGKK